MSFDVPAEAYDSFMGRYSRLLPAQLADWVEVRSGMRVIDVGAGTGALTGELVGRLGARSVVAVDPSQPFVAAIRQRYPAVDVREASAAHLPFPDDAFDASLAQLVVHFMPDPVAGIAEMRRVTRPGGVVAACVWDSGTRRSPLQPFWDAVRSLDPTADDESELPGTHEGHLGELFREAGVQAVETTELAVSLELASFEAWWEPFTRGVGPAGAYLRRADAARAEAIRQVAHDAVPEAPFTITAVAWAAKGLA